MECPMALPDLALDEIERSKSMSEFEALLALL